MSARRARLSVLIAAAALAWPVASHAAEVRDLIKECAYCHGEEGIAKSADVPNLAGQHREYLFNQLKAFRGGARPHKEMRYMSRHMTETEMRAIADYFSSLPPR